MLHGIDTDFLVALTIVEHEFHTSAMELLEQLRDSNAQFAICPQTISEFIHVVSDQRRFPNPLSVSKAINFAEYWWIAEEVVHLMPSGQSVPRFMDLMRTHQLGRKRLNDTMLAASFFEGGVRRLITNNGRDYRVFDVFEIVEYR